MSKGILLIVIIAVIVLIFYWNAGLSSGIETRPYTVEKTYEGFEIRQYSPVVMASVSEKGRMMETSNSSFRLLAGYIFGGNATGEKIAMTAPVLMQHNGADTTTRMSFMMPSSYLPDALPAPRTGDIEIHTESGYRMAVKSFGGFASNTDIEREAAALRALLSKHNIAYQGSVIYMGYNPPFQLINRRNEVAYLLTDH